MAARGCCCNRSRDRKALTSPLLLGVARAVIPTGHPLCRKQDRDLVCSQAARLSFTAAVTAMRIAPPRLSKAGSGTGSAAARPNVDTVVDGERRGIRSLRAIRCVRLVRRMRGRWRRVTLTTSCRTDCLRRWTVVIKTASLWRNRCSGILGTGKDFANGATPRKRPVKMAASATRPYGTRRICDG